MKSEFDVEVLPPARRLQYRMQTVRYRAERLRGWQACFRQINKMDSMRNVLTPGAVEQAHRPCVLMDVVGLMLWKN
jgi:hypothetical protein